jgi:heme-degrading monooxygenase HmoA
MQLPAKTPEPPYYAVLFSSVRTPGDGEAYGQTAERMVELAQTMPGFLGVESVRGADGFGITISYWESEESIQHWREHAEHLVAQAKGRAAWYARFELRVCKVERAYSFERRT